MSKILNVYLDENLIGQYYQEITSQIRFKYSESWLTNSDSFPISCSLPLRSEEFGHNECRAFFGGLLPEGDQRTRIAKNLGITDKNDFSMLSATAGEVIGALTLLNPEEIYSPHKHEYQEPSDEELSNAIKSLPKRPLLAGQPEMRMSLAGAQLKLTVRIKQGKFGIPIGSSPGSHIIKPTVPGYASIVQNEAYCMKIADQCGLKTAEAKADSVGESTFLLIKRFDRIIDLSSKEERVSRLHQEDFCQALGISSLKKYQNEGGPCFKDCFELIRKVSDAPALDILQLLDIAIFNLIIGNNDAHGKNFSLLYTMSESKKLTIRLSPFYDLISTVMYPDLSPNMAMKFGAEKQFDHLKASDFDHFARDAKIQPTAFKKRAIAFCKKCINLVNEVTNQSGIESEIAQLIRKRSETILNILRKD